MARATEFTLTLEDRPGTLADVAEALGKAGVNIDAMQGMATGGKGMVNLITSDTQGASKVFGEIGVMVTTRDMLLVKLEDKPGALGKLARAMANAGVNITGGYIAMNGTVVLGVSDMAAAEKVAGDIGAL